VVVQDFLNKDFDYHATYSTASTFDPRTNGVVFTQIETPTQYADNEKLALQRSIKRGLTAWYSVEERMYADGLDITKEKKDQRRYRFLLYGLTPLCLVLYPTVVLPLVVLPVALIFGLKIRKRNKLRTYKVTREDYEAATKRQNGLICLKCENFIIL
jgi:hypothetical protein